MHPVNPRWFDLGAWLIFAALAIWAFSSPWWSAHPRTRWWAQGFAVFWLETFPVLLLLSEIPLLRGPAANSNAGLVAQLAGMVAVTVAGIHASRWAWRRVLLPAWGWLTVGGTVRRAVVLGSLTALAVLAALRVWVLVILLAGVSVFAWLFGEALWEVATWAGRWTSSGRGAEGREKKGG